jgi:hypothetical protein
MPTDPKRAMSVGRKSGTTMALGRAVNGSAGMIAEASMVDGQFIQMSSVALHIHPGTVRETTVTVLYALDSLGNIWKLMDQSGQKWTLMTNER